MSASKITTLVRHSFQLAWSYKLNFVSQFLAGVITILLYYFLDLLLQRTGQSVISEGSYFTFVLLGSGFLRYLTNIAQAFSTNLR